MSGSAINKRAREIYDWRKEHGIPGSNLDDWRRAEVEVENEKRGMVIATAAPATKIGGIVTPEIAKRSSVRASAFVIKVVETV